MDDIINYVLFDEFNGYDLRRHRRRRTIRPRINYLEELDDIDFTIRFRLSKVAFTALLAKIEDSIKHDTDHNDAIQPTIQLLVTLRFYATGSFFRTIGDFCGISVSSAQRIVQKVSPSIAALREEFIKLPTSHEEIYQNMENFYRIAKFVRVIGCIDCTHISVLSYGGNESELFRNRKGYFSINVQVVCNAQLQIIDIVARWPGSAHDSTIFNNSRIKALFEANVFGNGVLLGDSGYPNISYMMCPLQNPTTPAEQLYNESQIRTRATVERCFGIWKKRFPVLSVGMRLRKIETTLSIIVATAVLHNMINQYFEDDLINRQIYDDASALMQNIEERNRNDQNVTNMRHTMVEYFQRLI